MNFHELDVEWFERARIALRQLSGLQRCGYLDHDDVPVLRVEVPLGLMNELRRLAWGDGAPEVEGPRRREPVREDERALEL